MTVRLLFRRLYALLVHVSWIAVAAGVAIHYVGAYLLLVWAGETDLVASITDFTYYWVVTSSTVGYGDLSPSTDLGKWIVSIWLIPGGLGLFASVLSKSVASVTESVRKRFTGMADYSKMKDHTIIIGWQGDSSRRMVQQLVADHDRDIVLVTKKDMENPMPDAVKFVRGDSLTGEDVHHRSAIRSAARIIVFGETDDETMAAGLAAYGKTRTDSDRVEHIVAYFRKDSAGSIFKEHCPTAEVFVNPSVDLMVRACSDPGSTRVSNKLMNCMDGPTQYSMTVPAGIEIPYGDLFREFKARPEISATLFGVAETCTGDDLTLNAADDHIVRSGNILYYMSANRVNADTVPWHDLAQKGEINA